MVLTLVLVKGDLTQCICSGCFLGVFVSDVCVCRQHGTLEDVKEWSSWAEFPSLSTLCPAEVNVVLCLSHCLFVTVLLYVTLSYCCSVTVTL